MTSAQRIISEDLLHRILIDSDAVLALGDEINAVLASDPVGVAVVPKGFVLMPIELTAENGAKSLMRGEFFEHVRMQCPECSQVDESELDEDCEICHGNGEFDIKVAVEWDTIKDIHARAVRGLGRTPDVLPSNVAKQEFEGWYRSKFKLSESERVNYDDHDVKLRLEGWLGCNAQYGQRG